MSDRIQFYFDFVDPGSYLLHLQLKTLGVTSGSLSLIGIEMALPPGEMIDPQAEDWKSYCDEMDQLAQRIDRNIPKVGFVPWSRKAHELLLHAEASGAYSAVFDELFRAHFEDGKDLGRIDVLTGIATESGLDYTETKAVLDVDKHTQALATQRTEALQDGITRIPTIRSGGESLVGPVGINDLRTLFESPGGTTTGT